MPHIFLPEPNWSHLAGGSQEAAWIADRDRKATLAREVAEHFLDVWEALRARGAVYTCSAGVLVAIPYAADWYVSLAGFALKTLGNISQGPAHFGLERSAKGVVASLQRGSRVKTRDLEAFSAWVNSEIDHVHPPAQRTDQRALSFVLLILGGRVIGRGQNMGGEDAVVLVKSLLLEAFQARGRSVDVELDDGRWAAAEPELQPLMRRRLRFGSRLICDFTGGGDRPDIAVRIDGTTIAIGEIKGRKDESNVWESWMPQVADHMRTWSREHPDAARLFFGTLISPEMIRGESLRGTERVGFRDLHERGQLTAVYNVSKVAENDPAAEREFGTLVAALDGLIVRRSP